MRAPGRTSFTTIKTSAAALIISLGRYLPATVRRSPPSPASRPGSMPLTIWPSATWIVRVAYRPAGELRSMVTGVRPFRALRRRRRWEALRRTVLGGRG